MPLSTLRSDKNICRQSDQAASYTVKISLKDGLTEDMFDLLNGSSISYGNKNYTLVEDIMDHQEDIQEDQMDIEENQKNIEEDQKDIQEDQEETQEDYQEEGAKNTTEEAVQMTDDNSTVVPRTEASVVEEMVGSENLDSSIIIGCSAVGVVCLVVLILVVLYCTHSDHSDHDPDLRARQLKGEIFQTDPTIAHIFQVKADIVICFC